MLATVLAKVSNLIPEAGIWMNTQRPEWNDANNALVGNGVSMVTLYYLRRFLKFFEATLSGTSVDAVDVSVELRDFFTQIATVLESQMPILASPISNQVRKQVTDQLGQAGSNYRAKVYDNGFSGKMTKLDLVDVSSFVRTALAFLEHSIDANRREDHLFHSYNLMSFEGDGITIEHLSEILEGQVAVLSSGYLSPAAAADLLDSLRKSKLYRADQNSYLLYPNKALPRFLEKNSIPEHLVQSSALLQKMLASGDQRIISRDVVGGFHFNGNFRNAGDVKKALGEIQDAEYVDLIAQDTTKVLQIFEDVFNHKAFTGRSGTFFAYEGLGSIYWHMVSKLHLAVQEVCLAAFRSDTPDGVKRRLLGHYYEIGEGIGVHKSPKLYGAFPTDPYSHTPMHRGAQQPGMTGQVKEDILVSIGELGIVVAEGNVHFMPHLLRKSDFIAEGGIVEFIDIRQMRQTYEMPANSMGFTYCQVPVIYRISDQDSIEITTDDGNVTSIEGLTLGDHFSREVFGRTGMVAKVVVSLNEAHLN
jgi:hypothetical protein